MFPRPPRPSALMAAFCLATACLSAGCVGRIDRFTEVRVLARGARVADVDQACALGVSMTHAIGALGREGHPAEKALIVSETTAALCSEAQAWEAELDEAAALRRNRMAQGGYEEAVRDARIRGERAHAQAADRFYRAWQHMEPAFGAVGEGCPRLKDRDGLVYLLGLYAGTNALLHDRASGGQVDVPLDILAQVGRGAPCLDDEQWWWAPTAFQAAVWSTVPGSGPADVDAWALLEQAAQQGAASGVRLSRALQVLLAANAGRRGEVLAGIAAHADALRDQARDPAWALLDEYARLVVLHQADLVWTEAVGYRCPRFGTFPAPDVRAPAVPAPFGDEDPF